MKERTLGDVYGDTVDALLSTAEAARVKQGALDEAVHLLRRHVDWLGGADDECPPGWADDVQAFLDRLAGVPSLTRTDGKVSG